MVFSIHHTMRISINQSCWLFQSTFNWTYEHKESVAKNGEKEPKPPVRKMY